VPDEFQQVVQIELRGLSCQWSGFSHTRVQYPYVVRLREGRQTVNRNTERGFPSNYYARFPFHPAEYHSSCLVW
jgi:hypothetical protein